MKITENKGFNFALPFDPFRLLLAVLEKLGFILLASVLCGGLGVAYAVFKLGNTYAASITLVSEGWHTKRPDEGSAYVPMPISDEAVVIAANAEDVFDLAAEKISPGMPGAAVRALVGLEQLPGDGLFSVSANTSEGKETTLKVVTAYAEALMEYTARLRRDEARAEFDTLEKQLAQKQLAAKEIEKTIVEYSQEKGIIDPLATGGTAVAELNALKKSLSDAKDALKTNNELILSYIRKEYVSLLNQELAGLLAQKSEQHHLVLGKKRQIRAIEDQLEASSESGTIDLKEFESLLPSTVYLAVQRLKEQRLILENQIASYTQQLSRSESEMGGLPERSLAMAEMSKIRYQAVASLVNIRGKMNDADFFATHAPPALSIFHAPSIGEVHHKTLKSKAITLGILGLFGGAGAVMGLSLLLELTGRKVRTPMQAAIAAGAYPKLVYPPSRNTSNEIALRNFWIRGVARFLPGERRIIFPVIGEIPNESGFWSGMFGALQDEKQRIVFVDFSRKPLSLDLPQYEGATPMPVSQIDPFRYSSADLVGMIANFPEGHVLIVRWDMNPTSVLAELAPHIDRQYILTSQEVSLSMVEEDSRNYREVFGDSDGLVLVNSKRPQRSQMIVNRLQDWYLESYRRKDLRGIPTPVAH